jgi:glutathione S-transferase
MGDEPIVIYGNPASQPSRAIMWFCHENSIPFEFKMVDLGKGENKTKEFVDLNPNKTVPVLNDNGFVLYESAAILSYLARRFKVKDHWYPQDPRARGLVDQYLHWHHTHLRKGAASLFFYAMIAPLFDGSRDFAEEKKAAILDLETSLQIIDARLANTQFIAGDEISIADMQAATEFTQHVLANTYDFTSYANVTRWLGVLKEMPAYAKTHTPVAELFDQLRASSKLRSS